MNVAGRGLLKMRVSYIILLLATWKTGFTVILIPCHDNILQQKFSNPQVLHVQSGEREAAGIVSSWTGPRHWTDGKSFDGPTTVVHEPIWFLLWGYQVRINRASGGPKQRSGNEIFQNEQRVGISSDLWSVHNKYT